MFTTAFLQGIKNTQSPIQIGDWVCRTPVVVAWRVFQGTRIIHLAFVLERKLAANWLFGNEGLLIRQSANVAGVYVKKRKSQLHNQHVACSAF